MSKHTWKRCVVFLIMTSAAIHVWAQQASLEQVEETCKAAQTNELGVLERFAGRGVSGVHDQIQPMLDNLRGEHFDKAARTANLILAYGDRVSRAERKCASSVRSAIPVLTAPKAEQEKKSVEAG